MRGKNKCKILKQIRQKIAEENDIPLVIKECTYQGECSGTCPRCEAELRYLEQQLARRQALGKVISVATLSIGFIVGAVGCSSMPIEVVGEVPYLEETTETAKESDGREVCVPSEEITAVELDGDVAYLPETFSNESEDYFYGYAPVPVDPEATEATESLPGEESIYDSLSDGNE